MCSERDELKEKMTEWEKELRRFESEASSSKKENRRPSLPGFHGVSLKSLGHEFLS